MEEKPNIGGRIAGGKGKYGRVENDYYATPPQDVRNFLELIIEEIDTEEIKTILEPAAGGGHMLDIVKEIFHKSEVDSIDIDPKREDIRKADFLKTQVKRRYDLVITNPPFKHAKEFIEKSLEISNRYVMYYLKIQFLEGKTRKEWHKNTPLKYVYVYSYRSNPMRNGETTNPEGKPWSSTICYAWYVYDKEYIGEPIIRWI